jgi:cyclopropane fatty-acyl-phospholipid synthase-like methyltransferase
MSDNDANYQFGSDIGDDEVARLEVQGAAYAQATRMIFAEANIRPGMRVLDLGCGAGPQARHERARRTSAAAEMAP